MLLVLNLKMNLTKSSIMKYEELIHDKNVIVLPQYPYLLFFSRGKYSLGSQDVSKFSKGSYTGEVCAKGLKQLGVKYVLIGHSERKEYFNETINDSRLKMQNVVENDLIPIYCINESLSDYEKNDLKSIEEQLSSIPNYVKYMVVAYEPTYMIGNEDSDIDIKHINKVMEFIKEYMMERNISHSIIYGGGVNKDNVDDLKSISCIDGFIISSSALDIEQLDSIYKKINC